MNYDQKLREAMFEIEAICQKHEIMSFMVLQSKTHGEFKFIWPGWSYIQNEFNPDNSNETGIRIRYKHGVDDRSLFEKSVGSILSVQRLTGYAFVALEKIERALKNKMQIEDKSGPINNDGRGTA